MDDRGVELDRIRVPTVRGDYTATLDTITSLVLQLENRTGQHASVGVGIPGTITYPSGLVKNANSIWLNGKPLQGDLSLSLRREVRCANDANCFTVSEATDGAAKDFAAVFGVILGTGCGGGLAVNGRLLSGPNGVAGEWGHIPLPWMTPEESPGPACYCGRTGCMEQWVSGPGFEADYRRQTNQSMSAQSTSAPSTSAQFTAAQSMSAASMSAKAIVAAAGSGDPTAATALTRFKDRLARGLAVVADVLDPDAFVLGGGLSQIAQLYDGSLEAGIGSYMFGGNGRTPVLKNSFGDSSGVRGAAWLWPL